MAGLKRRILGIMVISGGICAALPFRNEGAKGPADARDAIEFPGVPEVQNDLTLQLALPTAPTAVSSQRPASAVAKTKRTPQPQEIRRDELQVPPSIAAAFEPLVTTLPVTTFPVANVSSATSESSPTASIEMPEKWHRISDGDSLQDLAERYLGNRDRWLSIFEANDGRLTDPDILPIGKEILIPHVRHPSQDKADDHLVPIPAGLLGRETR